MARSTSEKQERTYNWEKPRRRSTYKRPNRYTTWTGPPPRRKPYKPSERTWRQKHPICQKPVSFVGWELLCYRLTEARWKEPPVDGRPDAFPQKALQEAVNAARISERNRTILDLRYGLTDGKPKTLQQLGDQFHRSRERIRQIVARSLVNIRLELRRREKVKQQQEALGKNSNPLGSGSTK